jgi:hypothetical protein
MGERPKGPIDRSWTPPSAWQQALLRDIIARLNQHNDEDTLPRSPRGLFYDLRPNGMGNGLTYVKQPQMWCVRGEHVIEGEGRCQAHRGPSRRVDETHISPKHVQETLVLARRAGLVRENWIEDTRAPTPDVPYYSDSYAEDLVDALVDEIRHPNITWSPQNGQDVYLEVLVEAAGLIGRTARVCRPYGVPVYSGGGFDGLKGKRAFASRAAERQVPTVVLRISDYDDHGLMMSESTAADCEAWAIMYYGCDPDKLTFERIALTYEQADANDLLDAAGKAEADGLPVPVMDAILRDAIEARQDPDIAARNIERAEEETARVTELVLAALNGGEDE